MVNHIGLSEDSFWAPPGGGVEFGESVVETLEREFREETGLAVEPGRFMCVCEYLSRPLHAIELFFEVTVQGGSLAAGKDPEMASNRQLIASVAFLPFQRIRELSTGQRHALFEIYTSVKDLKSASGYWKI
jgi:8-oxo-dGTP diphosphatase